MKFVEEAILWDSKECNLLRVFQLGHVRGVLMGNNLLTGETIQAEIIDCQVSSFDDDGDIDWCFELIGHEDTFVLAEPHCNWGPHFLEMQALLILVYSLNVHIPKTLNHQVPSLRFESVAKNQETLHVGPAEQDEYKDVVNRLLVGLSELLSLDFHDKEETLRKHVMYFISKYICDEGTLLYDQLKHYFTLLTYRAVGKPHINEEYDSKFLLKDRLMISEPELNETYSYPMMHYEKDRNRLFVPFDPADPVNGPNAVYVNLGFCEEERQRRLAWVKGSIMPYINEPPYPWNNAPTSEPISIDWNSASSSFRKSDANKRRHLEVLIPVRKRMA